MRVVSPQCHGFSSQAYFCFPDCQYVRIGCWASAGCTADICISRVPAPIESVYGAAIASYAFSFEETTIRHPGRAVRMGIDDILRLPEERWREPETGTPNFGYTDSIYWFRTTVRALESASDFLATSFNIRQRVRPDKTAVNSCQGGRLAHAI